MEMVGDGESPQRVKSWPKHILAAGIAGKRVFLMAPIHHHYELKGWPEPQIIVRFWIISIICALIALSTLKLR